MQDIAQAAKFTVDPPTVVPWSAAAIEAHPQLRCMRQPLKRDLVGR